MRIIQSWLFCLLLLQVNAACQASDGSGNLYDFNALTTPLGYNVSSNGDLYYTNICGAMSTSICPDSGSGACQISGGTSYSTGLFTTTVTYVAIGQFRLQYSGGSPTFCAGARSSTVYLECDYSSTNARLLRVEEPTSCQYVYHVLTSLACPPTPPACATFFEGKLYDFSSLTLPSSSYSSTSGSTTYQVNVCADVVGTPCTSAGACQTVSGTPYNIGRSNANVTGLTPYLFQLDYTNGDATGCSGGVGRKTKVYLECNRQVTSGAQIVKTTDKGGCAYEVTLETSLACPITYQPCTAYKSGTLYDFSPLTLPSSQYYSTPSSGVTLTSYQFNVCSVGGTSCGSRAACRYQFLPFPQAYTMGTLSTQVKASTTSPNSFTLTYPGGSNPSCAGNNFNLVFQCDATASTLTLSSKDETDACNISIYLLTDRACQSTYPSATPSVSVTTTPTPSSSVTPTRSPSATSSATVTPTPTSSVTPTPTPSITPTPSASVTPTRTPSVSSSSSSSVTPTPSSSPTSSASVTPTPSASVTPTPTQTPTPTSSVTPTPSSSPTSSASVTPTPTSSLTPTPSRTPTPSSSSSVTPTPSVSPTPTPSSSSSRTPTPSPSVTTTPSSSVTPTPSSSSSSSSTRTPTPSSSPTSSSSVTPTPSSSVTPTPSSSPTNSASVTNTPTSSLSPAASVTPSPTSSATPTSSISTTPSSSITPTNSPSSSSSITPTSSPSVTTTPSSSVTPTPSVSTTPSSSVSGTPSSSVTPTPSVTTTPSSSVTPTPSVSTTPSSSVTPTSSSSSSVTSSSSPSSSASITMSSSSSVTRTPTPTPSSSSTSSASGTPTPSSSLSPTPSVSVTPTPSPTASSSSSETLSSSSSRSGTPSPSETASSSSSGTPSRSSSVTRSGTSSPSPTPSSSPSPTPSVSGSASTTGSDSVTRTSSPSSSVSTTSSWTSSASTSLTASPSASLSVSESPSASMTPSASVSDRHPPLLLAPLPQAPLEPSRSVLPPLSTITPTATRSPLPRQSVQIVDLGTIPGVISIPTGTDEISVNIPGTVRETLPDDTSLAIVVVDGVDGVASSVVDLTLINSLGQELTFGGEIELCFDMGTTQDGQACLGYLNEDCGNWVCEDNSLENKEGKLCGSTGHFSSFAILIGANLSSGCGSGSLVDEVVTWLSVAFGITAIVIVLLSAVIKEITIRMRRARIEGQFGRSDRVWLVEHQENSEL